MHLKQEFGSSFSISSDFYKVGNMSSVSSSSSTINNSSSLSYYLFSSISYSSSGSTFVDLPFFGESFLDFFFSLSDSSFSSSSSSPAPSLCQSSSKEFSS